MLSLHIGSTHEHFTLHTHQCAYGGCSHSVLAGSRLGNDARLAHFLGQQNLANGVVNLVGTRVIQVLTLQIQLAAILLAHAAGKIEWAGAAYIVAQQGMIFLLELFGLDNGQVLLLQVLYCGIENLWDVGSSEFSIITVLVYLIIHIYLLFTIYYLRF